MEKARVTRWFVEPLDAATNENTMADLMRSSGATEDKIYYRVKDNEGSEHDVVEVNYPFVLRMETNAQKFEHRFRVFTQVGASRMRHWPFGNQKKIHRTAEVKRVAKAIANLPARDDPKQ